ncbi:MAG TPA: hypothetical protein VIY73_13570, partial [Polyangiaceae bacterium]
MGSVDGLRVAPSGRLKGALDPLGVLARPVRHHANPGDAAPPERSRDRAGHLRHALHVAHHRATLDARP